MPVDNFKIRQNWISEQTEYLKKELQFKKLDDAFLWLTTSLLLDSSPNEIDPEDIVDGGQDKQIDFIHIEDNQDKGFAEILIVQAKNTDGFSSNAVIGIENGLDWIFERPFNDVDKLKNTSFKNKIKEIRQLRLDYGASNLSIKVFHITNGDKSLLSDEYLEQVKKIADKYSNLGFDSFIFDQLGAYELVELINESERIKKQINVSVPIIYDVNRASVMEFAQGDTKAFVCTISGEELAKLAATEPRDAIFDLNVRPYYGSKGKVNKDIKATCAGVDAPRFWFLNNGITMVCDDFDFTRDPDNHILKIKNAQIVNGCQTTVSIREAYEKHELNKQVRVLLRLYSTDNNALIQKITLTTNNQNKITSRDLRANDIVQRDIEVLMREKYGYFYERKNKQYKNLKGPNKKKIVPSPKAAQAYLAIVRAKPANARGYLGAIWSDFYSEIFEYASVVDLLVSYKIFQFCREKSLSIKKLKSISSIKRDCSVYGIFHIARTIGYFLLKDEWGHKNTEKVELILKKFEEDTFDKNIYDKVLDIVVKLNKKDKKDYPVPAMYFKNSISQRNLNSYLHNQA